MSGILAVSSAMFNARRRCCSRSPTCRRRRQWCSPRSRSYSISQATQNILTHHLLSFSFFFNSRCLFLLASPRLSGQRWNLVRWVSTPYHNSFWMLQSCLLFRDWISKAIHISFQDGFSCAIHRHLRALPHLSNHLLTTTCHAHRRRSLHHRRFPSTCWARSSWGSSRWSAQARSLPQIQRRRRRPWSSPHRRLRNLHHRSHLGLHRSLITLGTPHSFPSSYPRLHWSSLCQSRPNVVSTPVVLAVLEVFDVLCEVQFVPLLPNIGVGAWLECDGSPLDV